MSECLTRHIIQACFVPDDGSLEEIPLNKVISIGEDVNGDTVNSYIYFRADDPTMQPVSSVNLGTGVIEDRECEEEPKAEVFVVRLNGNTTGDSTEKLEGLAFVSGDIGNTFTLTGEYLSYTTQWLGDTEQDAVLEWNDISYLAGRGTGSALYQHASLPGLTNSQNLIHDAEITLKAQPNAFVEFRFKRLQP